MGGGEGTGVGGILTAQRTRLQATEDYSQALDPNEIFSDGF